MRSSIEYCSFLPSSASKAIIYGRAYLFCNGAFKMGVHCISMLT